MKIAIGLTAKSLMLVAIISGYFLVLSCVFVIMIAVAPFPNMASVFIGMIAGGTFVVGILVLIVGHLVLRKLARANKFRQLTEKDLRRMSKVRSSVIAFAAAQCLCAIGELTVTFFGPEIVADGEKWIWLGVCYPGLLYNVAYFFILFALRRKPKFVRTPPSSGADVGAKLEDIPGQSGTILLEDRSTSSAAA